MKKIGIIGIGRKYDIYENDDGDFFCAIGKMTEKIIRIISCTIFLPSRCIQIHSCEDSPLWEKLKKKYKKNIKEGIEGENLVKTIQFMEGSEYPDCTIFQNAIGISSRKKIQDNILCLGYYGNGTGTFFLETKYNGFREKKFVLEKLQSYPEGFRIEHIILGKKDIEMLKKINLEEIQL